MVPDLVPFFKVPNLVDIFLPDLMYKLNNGPEALVSTIY